MSGSKIFPSQLKLDLEKWHFGSPKLWAIIQLTSFVNGNSFRPKIKFLFSGATFHIPLTKSATLNRLSHCSLWWFSGALFFLFFEGSFLHFGGKIAWSPSVFSPWILYTSGLCTVKGARQGRGRGREAFLQDFRGSGTSNEPRLLRMGVSIVELKGTG